MDIQEILVLLIGVAAVVWAVWRIVRFVVRQRRGETGCSCGDCGCGCGSHCAGRKKTRRG